MKKSIALFVFVGAGVAAMAQNVAEIFVNDKNVSHEIWLSGSLQDSSRVSFFNYTRFRVDYESTSANEFMSYSTVNYEIMKGLGVATGGFILNSGFVPVVALNYFYQNETWLINVFPSVELAENPNKEVFLFLQYRPQLNERLRLFSQLVYNTNFTFERHNFSEQNLRLGLEYRSLQFGVGGDITQVPLEDPEASRVNTSWNFNFGVFLRKEF